MSETENSYSRDGYATEQGSLFSNADFTQRMKKAVGSMWLIEDSEADTVEQVKEQELLYADLRRQLIEKYGKLADLLTAQHFGAEIPANQWVLAVDYVMGRSLRHPICRSWQHIVLASRQGNLI